MTAGAAAPQTPPQAAPVSTLPQVVIDAGRFEGKEVAGTIVVLQGASKLIPVAADHDNTILTSDDVVTVQLDIKVGNIGFDVDKNGLLIRVQRAKPIEGTVQIVDVLRARDTRIR